MNVSWRTSSERCPALLLLFTEMDVAVFSCQGANKDKSSNRTSIKFCATLTFLHFLLSDHSRNLKPPCSPHWCHVTKKPRQTFKSTIAQTFPFFPQLTFISGLFGEGIAIVQLNLQEDFQVRFRNAMTEQYLYSTEYYVLKSFKSIFLISLLLHFWIDEILPGYWLSVLPDSF